MPYGVFVPMHRIVLLIAVLATATGCHTFQPASPGDLVPGQSVRVRVTGAYSDSLAPILQRDDSRVFEGVVASREASSFLLDVPVQHSLQGMSFETLSQRVEVPTSALIEVETRQLHKGRTIAAVGVAAAVVGTVVAYQLSKDSGGGSIPGGGGPVESVVSIDLLGIALGGPLHILGR
jgi:hypothetical protein